MIAPWYKLEPVRWNLFTLIFAGIPLIFLGESFTRCWSLNANIFGGISFFGGRCSCQASAPFREGRRVGFKAVSSLPPKNHEASHFSRKAHETLTGEPQTSPYQSSIFFGTPAADGPFLRTHLETLPEVGPKPPEVSAPLGGPHG